MTILRLQLEGERGSISLQDFSKAIRNWLDVLNDLDVGISANPKGTIDWAICDLSIGSTCVAVDGKSRLPEEDHGPQVATSNISGFRQIEREGTTPPYLSEKGVRSIGRMFRLITKGGVTGIRLGSNGDEAKVSAQGVVNARQLLAPDYNSLGSIEGRLEAISLHGRPRFVVYHDVTNRGIRCDFPNTPEWINRAKDALGHRVNVSGRIVWNAHAEQVRVTAEDLRRLRSRDQLPSIQDIAGRFPQLTGAMTTKEYLQEVRGG